MTLLSLFFLLLFWLFPPALQSAPTSSPVPSLGEPIALTLSLGSKSIPLVESAFYDEEYIQEYLKDGAVVVGGSHVLGEAGNTVIVGHSSGPPSFGSYREAFAHVEDMQTGEEFTITTSQEVLRYIVIGKEIVNPREVEKVVQDSRSLVTLVTCWPRFTNFKRLLVYGEVVGVDKSQAVGVAQWGGE